MDYATGIFVGGIVVLLVSRYFCYNCLGAWTPILMIGIWVSFMLFCNYVFTTIKKPEQFSK